MQKLDDFIQFFRIMNISSQYLLIVLLVQFMVCGILINFFSFWPFYKAYFIGGTNGKVYKQSLYRSIRNGDHQCNVAVRKLSNTCMNVLQISYVLMGRLIVQKFGYMQDLERMIAVGCSDPAINSAILHMQQSLKYLLDWSPILIFLLCLNIYIDYVGLTLSYGNTWNRMYRSIKRCCLLRCLCRL